MIESPQDSEFLREKVLRLSFRWQELREGADFLEWYGEDVSNFRGRMSELQVEITELEARMKVMDEKTRS